jgi:hypothetical protein
MFEMWYLIIRDNTPIRRETRTGSIYILVQNSGARDFAISRRTQNATRSQFDNKQIQNT